MKTILIREEEVHNEVGFLTNSTSNESMKKCETEIKILRKNNH